MGAWQGYDTREHGRGMIHGGVAGCDAMGDIEVLYLPMDFVLGHQWVGWG
jgi:hypothetical protein